ncbi:hypothetical protein DUNSADRAFT_16351, partial [Dunaliella salina]
AAFVLLAGVLLLLLNLRIFYLQNPLQAGVLQRLEHPHPAVSRDPRISLSQSASGHQTLSQPALSQPALGHPALSHPTKNQPASSHPALSQPAFSQPALGHPALSHPTKNQPASSHPALSQPALSQPALGHPALSHPAKNQPASGHPALSQPALSQPALGHPALSHPTKNQPASGHPALSQPALSQPALGHHALSHPTKNQPAVGHPALSQPALGHPALSHPTQIQPAVGHPHPYTAAHGPADQQAFPYKNALNSTELLAALTKEQAVHETQGKGYLAMCVVARDVHRDIREWVLTHLFMGVEKIFVNDHNSKPAMQEELQDFISAGLVEYQLLECFDYSAALFGDFMHVHMGPPSPKWRLAMLALAKE